MKLKLIVDSELSHEEISELGMQLENLGHNVVYPAGIAGRQHIRHRIEGQKRITEDFGAIQSAQAVLLANTAAFRSGSSASASPTTSPCSDSMLIELGVASYLLKPIFIIHPTGRPELETDLKTTVLNGDIGLIPKEILG
ncbi:hypothetical protein CEUSTIGMA_g7419.t1 [Chlamydomonas eustigma]|uniref:Uncharacterized protein n=1 Tax=Chlamydomonas eustigma TaxID=1157962 RepID=A0A250XB38_9CHLO|nr:hypothetical protein CEUSTIGMA_g7419.t1 [Chlamydomonas eustigma]|eukprot:GAX79980.1 hypothetical protein CEUSTIGMA_g7419.t1 [Chlamydomonas eustigma]